MISGILNSLLQARLVEYDKRMQARRNEHARILQTKKAFGELGRQFNKPSRTASSWVSNQGQFDMSKAKFY